MQKAKTIAKWKRSGGVIRARLGSYKGRQRLDIRLWYKKEGKLAPTPKGISLGADEIGYLRKALENAEMILEQIERAD